MAIMKAEINNNEEIILHLFEFGNILEYPTVINKFIQ